MRLIATQSPPDGAQIVPHRALMRLSAAQSH